MTRGLYGWKPTSAAKQHLDEQEAREAALRAKRQHDDRLDRSHNWLERYLARPRRSAFNWSTITSTTTQEKDHEEGKDGIEAQAAEGGIPEGMGNAPGEAGGSGQTEVPGVGAGVAAGVGGLVGGSPQPEYDAPF